MAHELSFSAIVSAINRHNLMEFQEQPKAVEGRLSLTAQFIQGVDICETAISEGLYFQAAALLKQEMETIEAAYDYEIGKRKEKKTPRMRLLKDFGKAYGEFNDFAHVGVENIHKFIVHYEKNGMSGPSVVPSYDRDIATRFYGLHVYFIIHCARQIMKLFKEIYGSGLSSMELLMVRDALQILQVEDIIKPAEEVDQKYA